MIYTLLGIILITQSFLVWKLCFDSDDRSKTTCKISEEWGGVFIGRKYCTTHDEFWDPPTKECPGLALAQAVALDVGRVIPFRIMGEDKVRELVPTHITATGGYGRTVDLVDRQTYEEQNRLPGPRRADGL